MKIAKETEKVEEIAMEKVNAAKIAVKEETKNLKMLIQKMPPITPMQTVIIVP